MKEYKAYYKAGAKPEIVEFDPVKYLTIEGKGELGVQSFTGVIYSKYVKTTALKKKLVIPADNQKSIAQYAKNLRLKSDLSRLIVMSPV